MLTIVEIEIKDLFEIFSLNLDRSILSSESGLYRGTLKELFLNGCCLPCPSLYLSLSLLPPLTHLSIISKEGPCFIYADYDEIIREEM